MYSSKQDGEAAIGLITRDQLQKLLDEDRALQILLDSRKARDVIRRFKVLEPEAPLSDGDGVPMAGDFGLAKKRQSNLS